MPFPGSRTAPSVVDVFYRSDLSAPLLSRSRTVWIDHAVIGVTLGAVLLSAGTVFCVILGWLVAFLSVRIFVRGTATYSGMLLAGFLCNALGLYWVWPTLSTLSGLSPPAVSGIFILVCLVQAVPFPVALALFRFLPSSIDRWALRIPIAWTVIEFIPMEIFPWSIGHSQLMFTPLVQIAEFGGVLAISFVMMWFVAGIYGRGIRNMLLPITGFAVVIAFGTIRISEVSGSTKPGPIVSLVQAGHRGAAAEQDDSEAQYLMLQKLTREIPDKPDLVVWPESSLPFSVHESVFHERYDERLPKVGAINLLVGAHTNRRPNRNFNSALFLRSDGTIPLPYHKRLPIPIGEYIPFEKTFPFLHRLNPNAKGIDTGTKTGTFDVPYENGTRSAKIAPILCYEEIFPGYGIDAVRAGADILVAMSDDSWSATAGETALRQHFVLTAFRSVETRRSVVRSAGTGITAVIDPVGRVIASLPPNENGHTSVKVPIYASRTVYSLYGQAVHQISELLGH